MNEEREQKRQRRAHGGRLQEISIENKEKEDEKMTQRWPDFI